MNLLILLLFGILSSANGRYKIPAYDGCVLRVLLCDDFTRALTQTDNSTVEMFQTIEELNTACEELSKFRSCLTEAKAFCKEHSKIDTGPFLLNNRRLAFDMCESGSSNQDVYLMVEGCVNKYSHSAIQFCTDRVVEIVGLDFYLGDIDAECRYLGTLQQCHIALITEQCGNIAGNLLKNLVVFRGERDYMCIDYDKERLRNTEAFRTTLASYIQQYRNKLNLLETGGKLDQVDATKNLKIVEDSEKDQVTSKFQSRISPAVSDDTSGNMFSEHIEDNRSNKVNRVNVLSRLRLMPEEVNEDSNEDERFSDAKYNYYSSENAQNPIDIELHSLYSKNGNSVNEFEAEGAYIFPNKQKLNPSSSDEVTIEEDLEEPHEMFPYKRLKSSDPSYRPYELYRPRVGEFNNRVISVQHLGVEDTRSENFYPKMSTIQETMKDRYERPSLNSEEICPILQENISELVNEPVKYSKENYMSIADPVNVNELKNYINFPNFKQKDVFSNEMKKIEEPEDINERNEFEEMYVVSPSAEIEASTPNYVLLNDFEDRLDEDAVGDVLDEDAVGDVLDEDADGDVLDEDADGDVLDEDADGDVLDEDADFPQSTTKDQMLEQDLIKETKIDSPKIQFLEFISNYPNVHHPVSYKFVDASTNHKIASEEDFSSKSEKIFSRRSDQRDSTDIEEIFLNAFEMLAEIKINMRRMRKNLKEKQSERKGKIMLKTEF